MEIAIVAASLVVGMAALVHTLAQLSQTGLARKRTDFEMDQIREQNRERLAALKAENDRKDAEFMDRVLQEAVRRVAGAIVEEAKALDPKEYRGIKAQVHETCWDVITKGVHRATDGKVTVKEGKSDNGSPPQQQVQPARLQPKIVPGR